jgi:murein DD-endopeptidase MepM/ murein hydrolase activator NlpD
MRHFRTPLRQVKRFMAVRLLVLALLFLGCAAPTGIYHTVNQGETLYRIARTYEVDERYIARLNGINDPNRIEVGQRIYIPGATALRSASAPQRTESQRSPTRSASAAPPPRQTTQPPATPARPQTPLITPRAVQPATPLAEKGKFDWPVRGRIIRGFSLSGPQTFKGLEIATAAGTPVLSAAAGKVTYSGDGIRGYGNLIILKHDDSFFTVYGFNDRILVENGAFVRKGERIALSGTPPGGGEPRLHFEIRHGKSAVNPIFYLP